MHLIPSNARWPKGALRATRDSGMGVGRRRDAGGFGGVGGSGLPTQRWGRSLTCERWTSFMNGYPERCTCPALGRSEKAPRHVFSTLLMRPHSAFSSRVADLVSQFADSQAGPAGRPGILLRCAQHHQVTLVFCCKDGNLQSPVPCVFGRAVDRVGELFLQATETRSSSSRS